MNPLSYELVLVMVFYHRKLMQKKNKTNACVCVRVCAMCVYVFARAYTKEVESNRKYDICSLHLEILFSLECSFPLTLITRWRAVEMPLEILQTHFSLPSLGYQSSFTLVV